jgi:hypothetical protein
MVLKGVLDVVQKLENAMKKLSIRISAKNTYWPFRDIYKVRVAQQFVNYAEGDEMVSDGMCLFNSC